jgi:hypothetical protein
MSGFRYWAGRLAVLQLGSMSLFDDAPKPRYPQSTRYADRCVPQLLARQLLGRQRTSVVGWRMEYSVFIPSVHEPRARWRIRWRLRTSCEGRLRWLLPPISLSPGFSWRSSARQRTSLALGGGELDQHCRGEAIGRQLFTMSGSFTGRTSALGVKRRRGSDYLNVAVWLNHRAIRPLYQ